MKEKSIPLVIALFVCSLFLNASSRTMSNLTQQVGYITVSGHYEYWDDYRNLRPTVWGRVWICDVDPTGYQRLTDVNGMDEWFTDANGNFTSGLLLNYDPEDGGGLDIVVFIFTWNWAAVVVNGTDHIYNFGLGIWYNCPDGYHVDFSYQGVPSDQIGAWIVFSYHCGVAAGWDYLNQTVSYEAPMVTCRWPYGNYPCYWTNGTIDLLDWACWWPDIILHEYGHHVMNCAYGYIPPSMQIHYMKKKSNSTTAWAEGWADFFPLAVFNNSTFILGINATYGIAYDLEDPTWCWSDQGWDDGDEVEGRVAGALWDIFDSDDDGYDSFSDGFHRVWNITRDQNPDTFQEFWDAWNVTYYTHPKTPSSPYDLQDWTNTLMAIFQNTIDYRGPGDVNGDGIVDMTDISLATDAFMTGKGDPEWDQRCDMNYDDWIDMVDISFIIGYFLTTYDC